MPVGSIDKITLYYLISLCKGNPNIKYRFVLDIPKEFIPQINQQIENPEKKEKNEDE